MTDNQSPTIEAIREGGRTIRESPFCQFMAVLCFGAMCAMGFFAYNIGTEQIKALNSITAQMERVIEEQKGFAEQLRRQEQGLGQMLQLLGEISHNTERMVQARRGSGNVKERQSLITGMR